MPRRRSIACAARARGRHSALIQAFAPIVSTDHPTQRAASAANLLRRRSGRFAQPKTRDAGKMHTATRATTALATKNAGELDAVSCRNQQGRSTNPFPPDALPLVQTATPSGPPRLELDTQAVAPVDLVLSAPGRTQTLPADLVLAVTDGHWCMAGVSQRQ